MTEQQYRDREEKAMAAWRWNQFVSRYLDGRWNLDDCVQFVDYIVCVREIHDYKMISEIANFSEVYKKLAPTQ